MNKLKKVCMAIGLITGATLGGQADAGVMAQSVLEITALRFLNAAGGQLTPADFTNLQFTNNASESANLVGVGSNTTSTSGPMGIDLAQICFGAVCPGQNDYSHHVAPPTNQYARSDTLLNSSALAPGGADGHTVAESQLTGNGEGHGDSRLGLNTSFVFTPASAGSITFDFFGNPYLIASITGNSVVPPSSAQASLNFVISITRNDTNTEVFNWSPNGGPGGITGGVEVLDPFTLNSSISSLSPNFTNLYAPGVGHYTATSNPLLAGITYTGTIRHTSAADALNGVSVPEPASLALIGVGLLGFAASRRRKS